MGDRGLCHPEIRVDVDAEHAPPLLFGDFAHVLGPCDTSDVAEDVDTTESGVRRLYRIMAIGPRRHVGLAGFDQATRCSDRLGGRVEARGVDVDAEHRGAFGGESLRDRPTHA